MEVSIGGATKMTLRETPGIITVITEKEIQTSGARDMVDLLRTVPGFEFAGDIENTVGLGVRGNYAMEGKVLLLIDGQEINETGYGSIVWGNRFLTDNIQKIEIIRGPGSAVYGGMAELAVINVITKSGEDLDGGYASSSYGISQGVQSRVNGQFGIGQKLDNGLNISLTGNYSDANRSNETIDYATNYLDEEVGSSTTQNYADSSSIKNVNINLGVKYKGLSFTTLYQDYRIQNNTPTAESVSFGGIYLGSKYEWEVNDKFTITPSVSWKKMNPWTYKGEVNGALLNYLMDSYRSSEKLTALYKLNDNITLTAGADAFQDKGVKPGDTLLFSNGKAEVTYSNVSAFGEVLVSNKIANFILGARYDKHSQFGDAFVPRFAITKVINKLHFKALASKAFRAPVIYNFDLNPNIKPEFTTVGELEVGYKLNDNMAITLNGFYTDIKDPIVFFYDGETGEEFYLNSEKASTIGAELDFKINYDWGYINTGYSFYKNNGTKAEGYLNELDKNLLNAYPAHKIAIASGLSINDKFTVAPTIIFNSKKVGYYYQDEYWENYTATESDPNLTLNLVLHYEVIENMNISLGAYDLLGQNYTPISAYDSGYYGTPTMGQEFTIKAGYNF